MSKLRACAFASIAIVLAASQAPAAVKVHALFGDGMVIQRDQAAPVRGWADKGEKVTVTLNGKSASTTADDNGKWRVDLPAQGAGGPYELVVAGGNTLTIKDVLLGDVWLCAGQSNMEMGLDRSANPKEETAAANFPKIRLFLVNRLLLGAQPKPDTVGQWAPCTPKSARMFTIVGFYFGKELHQKLDVPIGLIQACRGSTSITSWISRPTLDKLPDAKALLKKYDDIDARLPELLEKWKKDLAAWEAGKAAGTPVAKLGAYPEEPGPEKDMYHPAGVFNGQIRPLMPFAIKGIIWYHGEADLPNPAAYAKYFPALVADWRSEWGAGDIPFLFVQLANFGEAKADPGDSTWALVREAQTQGLSLPKSAMVVGIDIGEKDYFIKNKQPFAQRLALAARAVAYGEKIEYSGPMLDKVKIDGDKITVSFTHVGGGLVVKGDKLTGFAVAGADKKFVWAEAAIDGETVVLTSPVASPVHIRYGWADNPGCNLYNKEGLPAAPFRTDGPLNKP